MYNIIYITVDSIREAKEIMRALVEEKLIACANIFAPITSIYHYNNEVKESEEVVIIAKTINIKVEEVIKRVRELHSYECPCIIVLPLTQGNSDYLRWLDECMSKGLKALNNAF